MVKLRIGSALLAVALAVGCGDTAVEHTWTIRFSEPVDAVRVEARVLTGGCTGSEQFFTVVERDGASGMALPLLQAGTYGFSVVATNASCEVVAEGCQPFGLPVADGNVLQVVDAVTPRDACDALTCDGNGACLGGADAGLDAGLDAGGPDGGIDAGEVGDAGPNVPAPPTVTMPWNGVSTGTALVSGTTLLDHPQRPIVHWQPSPDSPMSYAVEWVACDALDLSMCDFGALDARVVVAGSETFARPDTELAVERSTPPFGTRYAFRVGACDTPTGNDCGYTAPRYVDVGRLHNDVDGDGTSELLLITSPSAGDDELREPTRFTGLPGTTSRYSAPTIEGGAYIGDYDGDGRAEIAVDQASGGVHYLDDFVDTGSIPVDAEDIVALGDVDGDGYADFAIALASEVNVMLGGPTFDAGRSIVVRAPAGVMEFPMAIGAAGDRDADGLADLAVVSRIGPDLVRLDVYSLATRVGRRLGSGEAIATGEAGATTNMVIRVSGGHDMDDDGRPEIAISTPLLERVHVLFGDGTIDSSAVFGAGEFHDIAMAQLDGTGRARVVVGNPDGLDGGRSTGGIWHMRFASGTFNNTRIRVFNEERFGATVSVGDWTGIGSGAIASRGGTGNVTHLGLFDGVEVGATALFVFPPGGASFTGLVR